MHKQSYRGRARLGCFLTCIIIEFGLFFLLLICFLCSLFFFIFVLSVLFFQNLFILPPLLLFMIKIQTASSYLPFPGAFVLIVTFQYLSANFVIFQNLVSLVVLALVSYYFMTLSQSLDLLFILYILKKIKLQNAQQV